MPCCCCSTAPTTTTTTTTAPTNYYYGCGYGCCYCFCCCYSRPPSPPTTATTATTTTATAAATTPIITTATTDSLSLLLKKGSLLSSTAAIPATPVRATMRMSMTTTRAVGDATAWSTATELPCTIFASTTGLTLRSVWGTYGKALGLGPWLSSKLRTASGFRKQDTSFKFRAARSGGPRFPTFEATFGQTNLGCSYFLSFHLS